MKYIKPALKIELAQAAQMLAESLPISDTTVDGGNALTKENDWDLWSDDEEQKQEGGSSLRAASLFLGNKRLANKSLKSLAYRHRT